MKKLTNDEFIIRLSKLYGTRYDLSKVNYTGVDGKVTLVCDVHGPWQRMAQKELLGCGCPRCNMSNIGKNREYNRLKTTTEFIAESKTVHGDVYDYSLVEYKNSDTKVKIICPAHGVFEQLPWGHLKYGCRQCGVHKSKIEKEWLASFNIPSMIPQYKLPVLHFTVDGFDPATNTVYEFYGDYWHGNPKKFASHKINKQTPKQKSFGQLYKETLLRESNIKAAGYNFVSIWESDYR